MSRAALGLRSAPMSWLVFLVLETGWAWPSALAPRLRRPPCRFAWGCPPRAELESHAWGKPVSLRHPGKAGHLPVALVQTGAAQQKAVDGESLIDAVSPLPCPARHPLPDGSAPLPYLTTLSGKVVTKEAPFLTRLS